MFGRIMRDPEEILNYILKDIETYKSLRSYSAFLKEDGFNLSKNTRNIIGGVVQRIDLNIKRLDSMKEEEGENLNPILFKEVNLLYEALSVRCRNALYKAKIFYVGDLVEKDPSELLRLENLGQKCLNEIEKSLRPLNLRLGLYVPQWRPINFKELVEKYSDLDIDVLVDN